MRKKLNLWFDCKDLRCYNYIIEQKNYIAGLTREKELRELKNPYVEFKRSEKALKKTRKRAIILFFLLGLLYYAFLVLYDGHNLNFNEEILWFTTVVKDFKNIKSFSLSHIPVFILLIIALLFIGYVLAHWLSVPIYLTYKTGYKNFQKKKQELNEIAEKTRKDINSILPAGYTESVRKKVYEFYNEGVQSYNDFLQTKSREQLINAASCGHPVALMICTIEMTANILPDTYTNGLVYFSEISVKSPNYNEVVDQLCTVTAFVDLCNDWSYSFNFPSGVIPYPYDKEYLQIVNSQRYFKGLLNLTWKANSYKGYDNSYTSEEYYKAQEELEDIILSGHKQWDSYYEEYNGVGKFSPILYKSMFNYMLGHRHFGSTGSNSSTVDFDDVDEGVASDEVNLVGTTPTDWGEA